jgi:membrane-associated phospholipid phosphatase
MEFLQDFGIKVIQALQNLSPVLDGLTRFFSFLGTPGFYLLLLPPLYWAVDKRLGKVALLALIFCAFVGMGCKQLLHLPRPYWLGVAQPLAYESNYGNPSTNASDSLTVLGYLAYRLNKSWLWAAAGLCIILIGFSRLYLGVQFPTGVLCGWLLGLGILSLLIWFEQQSLPMWADISGAWQVGIAFGSSILMILIGYGICLQIAASPDPLAWAGFAAGGRSVFEYYNFAGGLFGAVSGYVLMKKHADFQIRGTLVAKVCRCGLGFAGLGVIYFSLGWVIRELLAPETLAVYILQYIQTAFMALWALLGAPWLHIKLRPAAA